MPEYTTPRDDYYYTSAQSTPARKANYVSASDRMRDHVRSHPTPYAYAEKDGQRKHSSNKHSSPRARFVHEEPREQDFEYLPRYEQYDTRSPPPPYRPHQTYYDAGTDRRSYEQVPVFTSSAEPKKKHKSSRSRRFSFTTTQKTTRPTAQRRPSTTPKLPPQATAEDARRHRIPAGYSIKNWDPTEEPILLLGSVFDANSLGKWIYDWSVYFYGPATPMSEVAGELWLLLIQLAGKIKRAEECLDRIRQQGWRDVVDEFLEAGERLWQRFTKLLKVCEGYMWKAAKKECGGAQRVTMGKNSGCEFVDSMFGRDRELVQTEKFMASVRLWSWRFDKNCDEILRHPTA